MRFTGTLHSWNDARGFGFIEAHQGGQAIFVHIKAFPPGTGRPGVGLPLSFEIERDKQGKQRARAVQFVRAPAKAKPVQAVRPAAWTLPRRLVLPGFLLLYGLVSWRWPVSPWVALAYLAMSVLAFVAYALDKSAARQGRWRTPESTLHSFSLAGGWPGALLAQQVLRHKTAKPEFVAAYWGTVLLNMAGFVALHTPLVQLVRG